MKIIISPSKTQKIRQDLEVIGTMPIFQEKADKLAKHLKNTTKKTLEEKMKINGLLLKSVYNLYQNYDSQESGHAVLSYIGTVFKELELTSMTQRNRTYMNEHLRILSALYGVLRPYDLIKPYRLDMKMGLHPKSLYQYWKDSLGDYFDQETIINLASIEYATLIDLPMITIEFREKKEDGKYSNVGYYSKVARGKMLNQLLINQIEDVKMIKTIQFDGYSFNESLSNQTQWFFTR